MEKDTKPIYIFGHLNPDTDSTCAAVAYAYLKNKIDPNNTYIPSVLSAVNPEASYVLDRFNVPIPQLVKNLKPHVSDIPLKPVPTVHEMDSIKQVLQMIAGYTGRSLPVVDKNERLIGIVSISDLVPMLLASQQKSWLRGVKIPLVNIIENLELKIIFCGMNQEIIRGNIYLFNDLKKAESFSADDLIICNEIEYEAGYVRTMGAGFILVTDCNRELECLDNSTNNQTIMSTSQNTYEVLQGISQSFPIESIVRKTGIEYFSTYETVEDVKKNMLTSRFRRFPVVDEWGYIKGMISRSDLTFVEPKRVILVDHNEKTQSIEGIQDTRIIEVIDHHRVANVQTEGPLYFRVEPLGSTCTIVAKLFEEHQIEIPYYIAGLLMSGILSDTLIFKSPTSTPTDEHYAKKLADIAEIHLKNYGLQMITKGLKLEDVSAETIITTDLKRFTFGDNKVGIAQVNIGDFEGFYKIYEDIKAAIHNKCHEEKLNLFILMATSIVIGGTEVIAFGDAKWIAEQAFGIGKNEESIFLNDVFSRKKQIVPKLMQVANQ